MWCNQQGSNFTSAQVCEILEQQAGTWDTTAILEATFRPGAIYRNGSIWFQRMS